MKTFPKNFIFLSQLIGIPVIDLNTNERIGRVQDIVASLREMYPRASAVIVSTPGGKRAYLPWQNVRKLIEDRAVFVEGSPEIPFLEAKPRENEILLRDTFWDKQIVDISGSKVVRVNDLHLLREELNLWLVHVDIGITGLLRRLGWERPADFLVRLLF
ncbi:MAG: PRC-barrel domain-containing protein, partial [Endomicrobiales bacterium]